MTKTIFASITLLLLAPGCQEPDSVLLANLDCDPNATPSYSIQVMLSEPGLREDTKIFPSNGQPLHFPTSLALEIPRNHSGQLDLAFLARDASARTTAHATARTTLAEGSETEISVRLSAGDDLCGNGNIDPGEQCDDGNLFSFDGCDNGCQLEAAPAAVPPDAGTPSHPDSSPPTQPPPDALPSQSPDAIGNPDNSPLLGPNGTPCTIHSQNVPCLTDGSPCTLYSQCASWFCDTWATPSTCTQPAALGDPCTTYAQCGSGCCKNNQCVPYTPLCPG
jgi:cysteine-rich repeat protein